MKTNFLVRCLLLTCTLGTVIISCRENWSEDPSVLHHSNYLEVAKKWYENNSKLRGKDNPDLPIKQLEVDWGNHGYTINALGDSVIYIPMKSKTDTFYREISLTKNKLGEAFGVIKQYDGNPKIENTLLTIYSGSGLLLERAIYNYKSGRMRYVNTSKKSLDIAENIKNKISCDGCPGNMNDGFEIEEVVVTGYPGRETVEPPPAEIPSGPGDFTGGGSGGGASTSGANISLATWQTIVLNKPFSLLADIPCDIIRNWLATARRKLEKSQLDKLNTIKATPHIVPWLNEPIYARVQDINDAYSAVVNMDYFPIKINQLPTIGGNQLTPTQLLDYIRKNINTFVDTDRAEFTPYQYYGINDTELWNSSNPLNAVIGIDIGGHTPDNGSVIVSSYTEHMWTFTTIYDPKFQDHPVSGNRDFGFSINADGSLSIYTRGVDRITNWDASWVQNSSLLQLLAGGSPFGEADALWGSFQQKVSDFVNKNGGKAQVEEAKTYRPDWELVKRVLEGRAPLFYLSSDC